MWKKILSYRNVFCQVYTTVNGEFGSHSALLKTLYRNEVKWHVLNTCVGEAQICTKIIAILLMMHIPVVGNE
jgi:hypothetical protein